MHRRSTSEPRTASDILRNLEIMVVDDSLVFRRILGDVVRSIPLTHLIAAVASGSEALALLAQTPCDLVLLDVEMPLMNGLETLQHIRAAHPKVGVVMISGASSQAAENTFRALQAGAIEFITKPTGKDPEESRRHLFSALKGIFGWYRTRRTVEVRAEARPTRPRAQTERVKEGLPEAMRAKRAPRNLTLLAIGVSTGGPHALTQLLSGISPSCPIPVVVVQHMPSGFTTSLASQIDKVCPLDVKEAKHGEILAAGMVRLAPGGRHMTLIEHRGGYVVSLNDDAKVKAVRPSVDVLFHSLAKLPSAVVLTVMMTGMGDDGVDGVRALTQAGSYNLAQDESTCVVYGMPKAVVEADLAHEIVPLPEMAERLNTLFDRMDRR